MKRTWFFILAIFAMVISGCISEPEDITGCTDPESLTYNANATIEDPSLCFYLADAYAGNYFAVETVTQYDALSGDSTISIRDYNFRIVVDRQPDDVFVMGFGECPDTLMGGTSDQVLTITDGSPCNLNTVAISRISGELSWDYTYNFDVFNYRVKGNAVRQ